jgi:hypothetical protein
MKKYLFTIGICLMGIALVLSCSKDDDKGNNNNSGQSTLQTDYFTVSTGNGVRTVNFVNGSFPSATLSEVLETVTYNARALAGGNNFIDIISTIQYSEFYIGARGVEGYYLIIPNAPQAVDGRYEYMIPIDYTTLFDEDVVMLIAGKNANGVTKPYSAGVKYVSSQSGDLEVNLTFSNDKDVDLHLVLPDSTRIYWDNRGETKIENGDTIICGLDHDSNPACSIDGLKNENIVIPADFIQAGTYRVIVNMYENCDASTATSWRVQARYKGNIITPKTGVNPATGVYPVGQDDDDFTEVMTFVINEGSRTTRATGYGWKPIQRSEWDMIKLDEYNYRMGK